MKPNSANPGSGPESHIYIHVPFCVSKCPYCDFYSVPYARSAARRFIKALQVEIRERLRSGAKPRTIYIGGGTPTVLDSKELSRLLEAIRSGAGMSQLEEFTVEVNPGTLSDEKISILREHGVNRISLGVQSLNDEKLKTLGRIHNASEAREAFESLAVAGFDNIGIDLIYGVPGDSESAWLTDLKKVVAMQPKHVSIYCLSVEPGTAFAERRKSDELNLPGDKLQSELYYSALDYLGKQGFEHYEISNLALPGCRSRHNTATWRYEPYLGFGPAAASFDSIVRRRNTPDIAAYCNDPIRSVETERLSMSQRAAEVMMLALRMLEGISESQFYSRSGQNLNDIYRTKIEELEERGLLERIQGRDMIRLTRSTLFVSDEVFVEFL